MCCAGDAGNPVQVWTALFKTFAKVGAFIAVMLIVGRRVIPWMLERVAGTGSRELFTLCVLAIALGVAFGSAAMFGVSFALGAFFAGMLLNESEFSHQAATETLPLRDAFAVLFFVSVGMLFDPMILVEHPLPVLATFAIIVLRQIDRGVRDRARVRQAQLHRAADFRQPGPDRRVLLHPRRPGHGTEDPAEGGPRPDPGRRAAVDHRQSAAVRRAGPARGA